MAVLDVHPCIGLIGQYSTILLKIDSDLINMRRERAIWYDISSLSFVGDPRLLQKVRGQLHNFMIPYKRFYCYAGLQGHLNIGFYYMPRDTISTVIHFLVGLIICVIC